ncbi:MAG: fatty acid desaturase [Deltaproteobacteria bacterium]|nr:fatty acid desaturase [Deltaproteobacteria bacterium]
MRADYPVSAGPNPHIERAKEILKRHPDVRKLVGPYPLSALCAAAVVAGQLLMAYALRDAHWLVIVVAAYLVGAFASHALFVLIHDASHNLTLHGTLANRLIGLLCNVGQGFPSAMSFRTYHLLHHWRLDEYDYDADLAYRWEARLVGTSPLRKALWLLVFAGVEVIRPLRIRGRFADPWLFANVVLIAATDYLVWRWCGFAGLAYVLLSTFAGIGLHPLGARWIQEHYTFVPGQETYSYYGILNRVSFNIGYHNEHHDLMRVPWVHLPKLKALAPEFYEPLHAHRSLTRVLLRWIFDPELDLFARITRDRGRAAAPPSEEDVLLGDLPAAV